MLLFILQHREWIWEPCRPSDKEFSIRTKIPSVLLIKHHCALCHLFKNMILSFTWMTKFLLIHSTLILEPVRIYSSSSFIACNLQMVSVQLNKVNLTHELYNLCRKKWSPIHFNILWKWSDSSWKRLMYVGYCWHLLHIADNWHAVQWNSPNFLLHTATP